MSVLRRRERLIILNLVENFNKIGMEKYSLKLVIRRLSEFLVREF